MFRFGIWKGTLQCVRARLLQLTLDYRLDDLDHFMCEKTWVPPEAFWAYLSDGRPVKSDNVRELAGLEDPVRVLAWSNPSEPSYYHRRSMSSTRPTSMQNLSKSYIPSIASPSSTRTRSELEEGDADALSAEYAPASPSLSSVPLSYLHPSSGFLSSTPTSPSLDADPELVRACSRHPSSRIPFFYPPPPQFSMSGLGRSATGVHATSDHVPSGSSLQVSSFANFAPEFL